jgi:aryl-alcohol dehydrogenase-like predicted oxidoreductase
MNYRPLGATGLKVSELGFGCSKLGGTVERQDDREVLATLQEALASGVTYFDTADSYGQGRAEELLGKVLAGRRASVVIASKAGYQLSAAGGVLAKLKPLVRPLVRRLKSAARAASRVRAAQIQQNFSPEYVRAAVEGSLHRLRTDYLDVFQLHSPPAEAVSTEGLHAMLERLQREGKIRHFGVACAQIADAGPWLRYPGVTSLQIRLNMGEFEDAMPVMAEAARHGIGIVAREVLRAAGHPAAEALPFVLQFPEVSTAIVGMRSRKHLRDNLQAVANREKVHAY